MSWLDKILSPFKKKSAAAESGSQPTLSPSPVAPTAEEKSAKAFFYRKWKDPAFLKQLKALQAHMANDGVNVTDKNQVEEWLKKNKTRLESGELQEPPADAQTQQTFIKTGPDVGRNDPCLCGSGKKYKKCCLKPVA